MGGHPKQSQGGGASMPAAPAGPKLVNNQIPTGLHGAIGGAWTPEQTKAGGRWEVPAGAPAGAIGRNWVTPPAAPAQAAQPTRDNLAHMVAMAASNNGISYPNRDFWTGAGHGGAWMEGGRGGGNSGGSSGGYG